MEYGTIERVIEVNASPEIVFSVVSQPEHLRDWWPDEANFERLVGAQGQFVFQHEGDGAPYVATFSIVELDAPRRFSFRWVYDDGATPGPTNSLLVSFELEPHGEGTRVTMTETGFRERGWSLAELEHAYQDHSSGWDFFLARLAPYAETVGATR